MASGCRGGGWRRLASGRERENRNILANIHAGSLPVAAGLRRKNESSMCPQAVACGLKALGKAEKMKA